MMIFHDKVQLFFIIIDMVYQDNFYGIDIEGKRNHLFNGIFLHFYLRFIQARDISKKLN